MLELFILVENDLMKYMKEGRDIQVKDALSDEEEPGNIEGLSPSREALGVTPIGEAEDLQQFMPNDAESKLHFPLSFF